MSRKILFLDIDWVLCVHPFYTLRLDDGEANFAPECLYNLNKLFEIVPNLEIVVSSTIRNGKTIRDLQNMFLKRWFSHPFRIIDKTPNLGGTKGKYERILRWDEINDWLSNNCQYEDVNYVIIDDDSDMLDTQMSRFVQTDTFKGFTSEVLQKVLKLYEE